MAQHQILQWKEIQLLVPFRLQTVYQKWDARICIVLGTSKTYVKHAGACLHLSHVGSKSGLIFDSLTLHQRSRWTTLNCMTVCLWQTDNAYILWIISSQVSSGMGHLDHPTTCSSVRVPPCHAGWDGHIFCLSPGRFISVFSWKWNQAQFHQGFVGNLQNVRSQSFVTVGI